MDTLQMVSLAYANTMLVYSVVAALFAAILYRCAKDADKVVHDEEKGSGGPPAPASFPVLESSGSSGGGKDMTEAEMNTRIRQLEAQVEAKLAALEKAVFAKA